MINVLNLAVASYRYRKAAQVVDQIDSELTRLFKAKEFQQRHEIIKQWSNASVKRNKLQKTLLKELSKS